VTFPFFKCWQDGQPEDAAKVISACDTEQAAQEFLDQWLHDDPDRGARHVNGKPVVVLVRDDVDGELTKWEVQATATVEFSARLIDNDPVPHVVTRAAGNNTMPIECLHCGASITLALPVSVDEMAATTHGFVERHRGCVKPAGSVA